MGERRGWRGPLIALTIACLALGIVATFVGGPDDTGVRVTADADGASGEREAGRLTRPIVPAAPDDGTASKGLPIVVDPAQGLRDDQTVTVSGSAFTPGIRVGVVMCRQNAREGGGISHCDISRVAYADVGSDGTFTTTAKVMRFIVTPADGEIDCASGAPACVIAAGNLSDYDESGGAAVTFEPTPPPPPPTIAVIDERPLVDGEIVRIAGAGYRPGTQVTVMQCPDGGDRSRCVPVAAASPGEDGSYEIPVRVWRYLLEGIDCAPRGCVLQTPRTDGLRSATTELRFDPNRPERASPPSARVEPTRGLHDGDTITVTGTGFSPSTSISLVICADMSDTCVSIADAVPGDDGSINTTAKTTALITSDHDETGRPRMMADCRATPCHLLIMTMPPRDAPLRFEIEFVG